MKLPFITKKSSLFFSLFAVLGAVNFAHSAPQKEVWETRSLGKDDARGANTILAVARNARAFAKWLDGKPLNSTTRIIVGAYADQEAPTTSVNKKTNEITTVSTSKTLYVLSERNERGLIQRLLPVIEVATTTVVKDLTPTVYDVAGEKVKVHAVKSATTSHQYLVQDVGSLVGAAATDASKDRVGAFAGAIAKLYAEGNKDCIEHVDNDGSGEAKMKLCRVSNTALALLTRASNRATALADKIEEKTNTGKYRFDDKSSKTVSYQVSNTGKIKNVVLSGFIRGVDEKLEAPDSVSAWVVKIDVDANNNTLVDVVAREDNSAGSKVNIDNLSF